MVPKIQIHTKETLLATQSSISEAQSEHMHQCGELLLATCRNFRRVSIRHMLRDFHHIIDLLAHVMLHTHGHERMAAVGIPGNVLPVGEPTSRLVCFDMSHDFFQHTEQQKRTHGPNWMWDWIFLINCHNISMYCEFGSHIVDVATHASHLPVGFKHIIPSVKKPLNIGVEPVKIPKFEQNWSQYLSEDLALEADVPRNIDNCSSPDTIASPDINFVNEESDQDSALDWFLPDTMEYEDFSDAPWLQINDKDLLEDDTWCLPSDSPKVSPHSESAWFLPQKNDDDPTQEQHAWSHVVTKQQNPTTTVQCIDELPSWDLVESPLMFSHERELVAKLASHDSRSLFYGLWPGAVPDLGKAKEGGHRSAVDIGKDTESFTVTTKTTMAIQQCKKVATSTVFGQRIALLTSCRALALELCNRIGWLNNINTSLYTNPAEDRWRLVVLQSSLHAPFILSRATHVIVVDGFVASKWIVDLHDSLHCRVTYLRVTGIDPSWESPPLLHWFPPQPSPATLELFCNSSDGIVDLRMLSLASLQKCTQLRLSDGEQINTFFVHQGLLKNLSMLCTQWWSMPSNLLVNKTRFDHFALFCGENLSLGSQQVNSASLSCAKTFWLAKLILDNLGCLTLHVFHHDGLFILYHISDEALLPPRLLTVLGDLYIKDFITPSDVSQKAFAALHDSLR